MNKYQVKWSKKLVGKKVYACSVAISSESEVHLSDSRRTSRDPVLCEAVVVSVSGMRVVVKPSNFEVVGEKDSAHVVSSRELWYTSPRAAVLARLKEIYECIAKSIRPDRVDRIFCETVFDGDLVKLDGRRDPGKVIWRHRKNVYSYEKQLELAQFMEGAKHYPCDHGYHDVIGCLFGHCYSLPYKDYAKINHGMDPLTVVAIEKKEFLKGVRKIKSEYGEDVTECFEKTDDEKYKVRLLSVYQLLKAKGRIKLPIITKEWLRSVARI